MYKTIVTLTAIKGAGMLASFLFLTLISIYLSQGEIGIYGKLLAYVNIGVAICSLGFEKLLIRDFRAGGDYDYVLFDELLTGLLISACVFGAVIVYIFDSIGEPIAVIAVAVFVTIIGRTFQRAIRLVGWPKVAMLIDVLVIRCGLLVVGIVAWSFEIDVIGADLFVYFVALSSVALLVYLLAFYAYGSHQITYALTEGLKHVAKNLQRAKHFWMNSIVSVLAKEVDVIVAFQLLGASEAASLFVGRRFYNIMSALNQGAAFGFEQDFSKKSKASQEKSKLFAGLKFSVLLLSLVMFVGLGFGLYLAEYQFHILENVFFIGLIFMTTRVIENSLGPVFLYLNMRGEEAFVFVVISGSLILKLLLFYSIPDINVFGMALVTCLLIIFPALCCLKRVDL